MRLWLLEKLLDEVSMKIDLTSARKSASAGWWFFPPNIYKRCFLFIFWMFFGVKSFLKKLVASSPRGVCAKRMFLFDSQTLLLLKGGGYILNMVFVGVFAWCLQAVDRIGWFAVTFRHLRVIADIGKSEKVDSMVKSPKVVAFKEVVQYSNMLHVVFVGWL